MVDTNVLVAALIKPDGRVAPVVVALREGRFKLLYSRATLEELVDVLSRPWLKDKYAVTDEGVEALLKLVLLRGEEVEVTLAVELSRDPTDDEFLAVAIVGEARYLVNRDLRDLGGHGSVEIVSPARFLEEI